MDSYPEDLLAGVFPLVFAVDAILPTPVHNETESTTAENKEGDSKSPASTRSLFDRFLDTMAASLVEEEEDSAAKSNNHKMGDSFASLLRGELEDSSDDEEDPSEPNNNAASAYRRSFRRSMVVGSPSLSSFRKTHNTTILNDHDAVSVAYARSLKTEQFFQRARILSISTRHGFPPSKDFDGDDNFALKLNKARSIMNMTPSQQNALRLKAVLEDRPIDGILPSGWLEKHVHALPSVLVVVTSYQKSDADLQNDQDQHLLETLQHLRESLASKRECEIRLVALTETPTETDAWMTVILSQTELDAAQVTVVDVKDLQNMSSPGMPISWTIQNLYKNVRNSSWTYYQHQAKRVKRKLAMLGHDHQPALMPLAIRYCFKIAMFYEFLLKHEKSIGYFAEAYRHLATYYQNLMGKNVLENLTTTGTAIVNPQGDEGFETALPKSANHSGSSNEDDEEEDGGIEVALADSEDTEESNDTADGNMTPVDVRAIFAEMVPLSDIGHQCRAVADWLNFKLLQAGFLSSAFSESEDGLIAAAAQWRKFSQVFLKLDDPSQPIWSHWDYVAHQRLVMSQLVERYPPKSISSLSGLARDEVFMLCSAWRNYLAAAEALLRLGVAVEKVSSGQDNSSTANIDKASLRGRCVGGLDSEWLSPKFHLVSSVAHKDKALDLLLRAISLFEAALEKEKGRVPEQFERCYNRSGTRLYYLVGGLLLGKERYQEAVPHLEKALRGSTCWNGLEVPIRHMLIKCYEKHAPSHAMGDPAATSMVLDSYFNSEMSTRDLRQALDACSAMSNDGVIKWHYTCIDEADSLLPFFFSVSFPGSTHATAGDTVTASVFLQSNLTYNVRVNSLTLLSMAGNVQIPSDSLLSAENASESRDGCVVIQAKSSILLSIQIDLPRELDGIVSTDDVGEKNDTSEKTSYARSARPRSAGITSAAGGRLVSELMFEKGPRDGNAQWSVRYLGGKALRCDGICLSFYPVQTEAGTATDTNVIELTIQKKKAEVASYIKRTAFEEDNYVASAWTRPKHLSLDRGPRCLRVLGPMPEMIVTNLSDEPTNGKALEGTVNRILLKLEAGPHEECRELQYAVTCSSTLLSMDGSTSLLGRSAQNGSIPADDVVNRAPGEKRTPVLVAARPTADCVHLADFGFDLPSQWELLGNGMGMPDKVSPKISTLRSGDATYIYFDLYRPPKSPPSSELVDENGGSVSNIGNTRLDDTDMCQTDFNIAVTYRQVRPQAQNLDGDPEQEMQTGESDLVSLEFDGSVTWTSPLSAKFTEVRGIQKAYPAGSRHPDNACSAEKREDGSSVAAIEVPIVDGERVTSRCTLEAGSVAPGVVVQISKIRYEESDPSDTCTIRLLSESGAENDDAIFSLNENDPLCRLKKGCKLGVVYNVQANMNKNYVKGSVSSHLGLICVDWTPAPIPVPVSIDEAGTATHGPLDLSGASTMKFRGLACYIESAPFEADMSLHPPSPRVGVPFEVAYRIGNKTDMYQQVDVQVAANSDEDTDAVLVSGLVSGELLLAPHQSQILSYTALATKAGKASLPAVSVSSLRYKTWILDDGSVDRSIFILP